MKMAGRRRKTLQKTFQASKQFQGSQAKPDKRI